MIYSEELAKSINVPEATRKSWRHRGIIPDYYLNHKERITFSDAQILELIAFCNRSLIKSKQFAEECNVHPQTVYDLKQERSLPSKNQLTSLYKGMTRIKKEAKKATTTEKQIRFLKQPFIAHSFAVQFCGSNLQSHLEGGFSLKAETEKKLKDYFNSLQF